MYGKIKAIVKSTKKGVFAFDDYKDFLSLSNTMESLMSHFGVFEDCLDKNIVIPSSKLVGGDGTWKSLQWINKYENKNGVMIINDANDRIFCNPAYLLWCLRTGRGVYLKKNLSYNYDYGRHMRKRKDFLQMTKKEYKEMYNSALYKCLFPNAESPVAQNVDAYINNGMTWKPWKERKYDVFWAGQTRTGCLTGDKTKGINNIKQAVEKLRLKALVVGRKPDLGRKGYMEAITNSRFCYNVAVGPLRNRREWEILLGGGCLVQDPRTKDMELNIMEDYKHFTYFSYDNFIDNLESLVKNQEECEAIARKGWELAQKCWVTIPTLNFRLSVAQGLARRQVDTIEDLEKLEGQLYDRYI